MHYFKYSGELHICNIASSRIQPFITDLQTGKLHKPVVTNKNKAFSKFWNLANFRYRYYETDGKKSEIYFTADFSGSTHSKVLKNVKFYEEAEFKELFAEYLI